MGLRIFVDLDLRPEALELLAAGTKGHQLMFPQTPTTSVLAQAPRDPQFVSAEVAFGQPDPQMIAEAPALKWVQVSSSGITRYDTREFRGLAASRGLVVCNSAHVYDQPCALHVLSFMLAQARALPRALGTQTAGGSPQWDALREAAVPLDGQSVVIVGYGAIGARLVKLLEPFAMKVTGFRRTARAGEAAAIVTTREPLQAALSEADHVVDILPASEHTQHFFDAQRFGAMKPGAVFYNIGRGATVDQDALLVALRSKRLQAAWLDVTDPEPLPPGHPLLDEPSCHITPHVAGGHAGEAKTLVRHFLRNLERFTRGEALVDRVM